METMDVSEIAKKSLTAVGLYSKNALCLVLGTCATESDMGQFRKQIKGRARGIFQMEKTTYDWLVTCLDKNSSMQKLCVKEKLLQYLDVDNVPPFEEIENNDSLASIFCRLRYFVSPLELPNYDNILGMAKYWKRNYNSMSGKGKLEDFTSKYLRYVKPFEEQL
jgi:hypothetical protein